jgi:hypothetical protein
MAAYSETSYGWYTDGPKINIFFPDKPGLQGWAAAIEAVVDSPQVAEESYEREDSSKEKKD